MSTLKNEPTKIPVKYGEYGGEGELYDFPQPLRIVVTSKKNSELVFSANPDEKPKKPSTPEQPGRPEQPGKPEQPIKPPGQPKPENPIASPQQNEENQEPGDKPLRPIALVKGTGSPDKNKNIEKEEDEEEYEVPEEDEELTEKEEDDNEDEHNEREDTAF